MFTGYATLGEFFVFPAVVVDGTNTPADPTNLPTFRVYSATGLMANGTGSAAKLDTGTITGATNATPIVITSASHGLNTGDGVTITGVGGNTAANAGWTITRVNANSFSLDTSVGNGGYTSGGTWHVTGLYTITVPVTAGNSYEQGQSYFVLVSWVISSTTYARRYCFSVS